MKKETLKNLIDTVTLVTAGTLGALLATSLLRAVLGMGV
jgi:hypothetical protein